MQCKLGECSKSTKEEQNSSLQIHLSTKKSCKFAPFLIINSSLVIMSLYSIAIHGGAGTILKEELTPELERDFKEALDEGLRAGYALLEEGGSAIDAVYRATVVLEDNPLFNAGRGSVFNKEGKHEMDAAIMDGHTLDAGAVACVYNVRNPIALAYEVLCNSGHVFLSGKSAEAFARQQGVAMEPDDYFFSEFRYKQWLAVRGSEAYLIDHSSTNAHAEDKKFGTVGAVARDRHGHVAAATSTGGMTNKQFGRIGDTPIIGAGTYANDKTCAISCTGHGELFIRAVAAYDVSCLME
ncbi:MAG: isoaspartyl peptidase/L-asparaginase, partial [Bacteroidota bacterium]|nr:isoaspartyl peptidase/L-asparaginase [Bacteroidota bacterium]